MTKIKICGITDKASLKAAEDADYVGFVVGSSKSSRNLGLDEFVELEENRTRPKAVVVTVNDDLSFLRQIEKTDPDIIQLHGEARKHHRRLSIPVAIAFNFDEYLSQYKYFTSKNISYFVVDSLQNGYGGSGRQWLWKPINQSDYEVFVAGGITLDNLTRALQKTRAQGVDISSGVEIQGRKSPQLIKEFIHKVRSI